MCLFAYDSGQSAKLLSTTGKFPLLILSFRTSRIRNPMQGDTFTAVPFDSPHIDGLELD